MAVERFNLKGYDLILSCSHCVAKGVIPPPDGLHISYTLTPMRYAWDMYGEYFGESRSGIIPFFIHYLRMWDVTSSERVDYFLCISNHVKNRVKKYYRREAEIIHPPVETNRFRLRKEQKDFFLIVSSFAPYKRIDLAIEAFNRLGYSLKIIGTGQEGKRLKSIAKSNIEFLGWQPDPVVADCYSKCRALIFPGEEDFGIVPLEAMASGRTVIAYGRGGVLETMIPYSPEEGRDPTGLFFHEPSVDSLIDGVERFTRLERDFDPVTIRTHALQWDRENFKKKIKENLLKKMESSC